LGTSSTLTSTPLARHATGQRRLAYGTAPSPPPRSTIWSTTASCLGAAEGSALRGGEAEVEAGAAALVAAGAAAAPCATGAE